MQINNNGENDIANTEHIPDDVKIPKGEVNQLTIEIPIDGFTPDKLDNLYKLVSSKASLLKAALGVDDLPIQETAETLQFPWFSGEFDGDTVKAYTTLIEKICIAAKEKKWITATERDAYNPKYAMRCWLKSIGFIGPEYKAFRKTLLSKLSSSSAFKDPLSNE